MISQQHLVAALVAAKHARREGVHPMLFEASQCEGLAYARKHGFVKYSGRKELSTEFGRKHRQCKIRTLSLTAKGRKVVRRFK